MVKFTNLLKAGKHHLKHYSQILQLFEGFGDMTRRELEGHLKSKFSIFLDYVYLFFVVKMLPTNYFLFEFDRKARNSSGSI